MVVISSGQITITDVEDGKPGPEGKPGKDGQAGENLLLDTNTNSVTKRYASQDRYYSNYTNHSSFDFWFVNLTDAPIRTINTGLRIKAKPTATNKKMGICWYAGDYSGVKLKSGATYTISCYVRLISGSDGFVTLEPSVKDNSLYSTLFTPSSVKNTEWVQVSKTFEFNTAKVGEPSGESSRFYFSVSVGQTAGSPEIELCGFKVEEGDHATPYTPSPIEAEIELRKKADSDTVLEQQRLLKESQEKAIAALNDEILRKVSTDWADLVKRIRDTDEAGRKASEEAVRVASARLRDETSRQFGEYAYVKEFITTEQVASEEGLSIGKRDNSERLVFTPNRISFMSGGKEIASIAQGRLNIDSGAFTTSLQIGRFITFQDPSDPTRNITKYIEG